MQDGGDASNFRNHLHHHRLQRRRHKYEAGDAGFRNRSPDHRPETACDLRRQVAVLLSQHHRSSHRNHHHPHPISPASYGSSSEMNLHNRAATPTSSIEPKCGFKTSKELLKVLNRIWTLEEQHESNVSLVKALKIELDQARSRIRELLRDQKSSRHEISDLMNQATEQERANSMIQSLRDELEDERRLRKRSEALHRRLGREVFDVKVALSTSAKELERVKKGHRLLEELCDEFAKGIMDYERNLHESTPKTSDNRRTVQMCESWLDERAQMKDRGDFVVDKLRSEIESFVGSRKSDVEEKGVSEIRGGDEKEGEGVVEKLMSELLVSEEKCRGVCLKEVAVDTMESSSKNSLKVKLREPKAKGGYRARLKMLKGLS